MMAFGKEFFNIENSLYFSLYLSMNVGGRVKNVVNLSEILEILFQRLAWKSKSKEIEAKDNSCVGLLSSEKNRCHDLKKISFSSSSRTSTALIFSWADFAKSGRAAENNQTTRRNRVMRISI